MLPKLFSYDSFVLPTYGVLVTAGLVAGLLVAAHLAAREGLEKQKIYDLGIWLAVAGILGSKAFLIFQERAYYWSHPERIFSWDTLQSGGIFYGGLVTALGVALWYVRRVQLPFLKTADAFAPAIALGLAIGRLGCFSAGCCWGEPASVPWAVTFTNPYSHEVVGVPLGIPLHPTQLYEAGASLAIFVFLYLRYPKKRFHGQMLGWYLLLYPAARFLIEFFRSHSEPAWFWGAALTDAQALSLLLVTVAVWLLWLGPHRHHPVSAAVSSHEPSASRRRPAKFPRH